MDLNSLTIGEAKELAKQLACFINCEKKDKDFIDQAGFSAALPRTHPFVGKYCIARCYAAGVHAGIVEHVDGENVILRESRRLWSWKAKDGVALSGVAQHGIQAGAGKVDVINPIIALMGVCELIPTTDASRESIHGYK